MAESCVITPSVRTANGEIKESKLFPGILGAVNNDRTRAVDIYSKIRSDNFQSDFAHLPKDSNGEFTLSSVIGTGVFKDLTNEKALKAQMRIAGFVDKDGNIRESEATIDSIREAYQRANRYNKESDDFIAVPKTRLDDDGNRRVYIDIEHKTAENSGLVDKIDNEIGLHNLLLDNLRQQGISVEALSLLEEKELGSGLIDFTDLSKTNAEGLLSLIKISSGERGVEALPEEFSHFVIETCTDNSLIKRLIDFVNDDDTIHTILGNEYDAYYKRYDGNNYRLAKEAAGKLLAIHLKDVFEVRNSTTNQEEQARRLNGLLNRAWNGAKSQYSKYDKKSLQDIVEASRRMYGEVANKAIENKLEYDVKKAEAQVWFNTSTPESEAAERRKELFEKILENQSKRWAIAEARVPEAQEEEENKKRPGQTSSYTKGQRELKERLEKDMAEKAYLVGIYDFLDTAHKGIKSALDAINKISELKNGREKAARLNKARDFIYSYEGILSDIESELKDFPEETAEHAKALEDVRGAFDKIRILRRTYEKVAKTTFEEFVAPFFEEQEKNPFTGEEGRKLASVLWESPKDITVYDAWLRAAANSDNEVIRLLDQIIKRARERGRQKTIDTRKRLEALGMKARNAGIKDFDWMFARDAGGHKTGFYVTRDKVTDSNKLNFYDEFMKVKEELDQLLPAGTTETLNAVKIRKDLLERMMSGGKMTEQIAEAIKDNFVRRGDDTDVDYATALEDFEGRKVNFLPIYYTQMMPKEKADDLSTDVISTMIAYAAMANDFYEMNGILQQMELGRDLLLDKYYGHKVGQTKGNKPLLEKLDKLGDKVGKQLRKYDTNFEARLNSLYEMNLYSRRRKDEGTVGNTNIDKGKLADQLNSITALNTLALNLTAGITNVVTGTSMLRIEAAAKEFMEYKDILRGDRAYALAMPEFFKEYGNSVKTNKLSLFDELFNVMQEYEGQIKNTNFDRKKWYSRMFEMDTLFFMNNCGEHWLQNRTALGLAYSYKMKDDKGNETNLWDALTVEYLDKQHPEYGAKLVIKEGYTKPDGSEFGDDDIYEFTRKAAAINQRMHGIYNKEDMSAIQAVGLGRMALLFRKYLVPSVDRRFRKAIYNYDLKSWEEGYYNTAGKFLLQLGKDLKAHKLNITLAWNNLTEPQKANIKRAGTEVGYLLAILAGITLLGGGDVDRKSRSFFLNELELQLKRQRAEIGSLVPSPMLANEALKIIKSPAAGVDTIEDMLGTLGILNPWNWTTEMQSGRYKGHSKAYKIFMTSPFVPMNSTIYKSLNPEEIIPFYNQ